MRVDNYQKRVRETFSGFPPFPRIKEFFNQVYDLFGTAAAWELEDGCLEILRELRHREIRMGVISNFDSRLAGVLGSLGIVDFFDAVIASCQWGLAKPAPEIFEVGLAETKSRASASVHVGDNIEEDFKGAREAGLEALLYDPLLRCPELGDRRIGHLSEIGRCCRGRLPD